MRAAVDSLQVSLAKFKLNITSVVGTVDVKIPIDSRPSFNCEVKHRRSSRVMLESQIIS